MTPLLRLAIAKRITDIASGVHTRGHRFLEDGAIALRKRALTITQACLAELGPELDPTVSPPSPPGSSRRPTGSNERSCSCNPHPASGSFEGTEGEAAVEVQS